MKNETSSEFKSQKLDIKNPKQTKQVEKFKFFIVSF